MDWDRFFIAEARRISEKSSDPSSKVGCVLTESNYTPISYGWNQHPKYSTGLPWSRPEKYGYVVHAEMDALLSVGKRGLSGGMAFLTDAPCESCLRHLIHVGVGRVVYESADIMRRWTTPSQLVVLRGLIESSLVEVKNINGAHLLEELNATL